jgi:hypothetical protein
MATAASARAEPLERQALVAEHAVEALVGAILPALTTADQHHADATSSALNGTDPGLLIRS